MREPSQFSESLINSSKPSASKKFVSIHGEYHLAGRDSIVDGDLSDCQKLLADPVSYDGRLAPALKYDKLSGDYSGVIDVGILYPSANISRDDNYDHEIWLLKSDGIYLKRGPDKYLFADYSISESPLRVIQVDSQTLYVVFEEPGHNYKLSYNYWRKKWCFGVAVPDHISLKKNYGITKQGQLSDGINDPGSISFHCEFERIHNSVVKFTGIDFEYEDKDQYEQLAKGVWLDLMDTIYYDTYLFPGKDNVDTIDTTDLVNTVKNKLEDYNMLGDIDGFSSYYLGNYNFNNFNYDDPDYGKFDQNNLNCSFRSKWIENWPFKKYEEFPYHPGADFSPILDARDGDVDAFICWIIGFIYFARPQEWKGGRKRQ